MAKYSESSQLIFAVLGDRPVAYHPKLAKAVGGVKQAIFVCQFLYWNGKGSDPDGWIYKTQAEIEEETGLSRYEQETVRKSLVSNGIMEERLKGIPATLQYRLILPVLYDKIAETYSSSLQKHPKQESEFSASSDGETPQTLNRNQENTQENTTPGRGELDLLDGILHYAGKAHQRRENGISDMENWPEDVKQPAQEFARIFKLSVPNSKRTRGDWIDSLRTIRKDAIGLSLDVIFEIGKELAERENWLNKIGRPGALVNSLARIIRIAENDTDSMPLHTDGSFYV